MQILRFKRLPFIAAGLLSLLIALSAGCTASHPYLLNPDDPRTAGHLGKLEDRLSANADYADLLELGWARWFLKNDGKGALEVWGQAARQNSSLPEARIARALAAYFEGNVSFSVDELMAVLSLDPGGPYAELAASRLMNLYQHTPDFPTLVQPLAESLIDDQRLNYRTRLKLTGLLALIYRERGMLESERKMKQRLGRMTSYKLSGPFGKLGLLDFDRSFEPELKAGQQSYHDGEVEVEAVFVDTLQNDIRINQLSDRGGVFYAESYIRLKEESRVIVGLETMDLSRLFVDGHPVLDVDSLGVYPKGRHEVAMTLDAGWHRLLLKLADSGPYIRFRLNMVSDKGLPLIQEMGADPNAGWDSSPKSAPSIQAQPANMESLWADVLEEREDLYGLFFHMLACYEIGDRAGFKISSEKALAINPKFAPLYVLNAYQVQGDPSIPGQIGRDQARADMTRALELDPSQVFARYYLSNYYLEREQTESAISELRELEKRSPNYHLWSQSLFNIYQSKGWWKEAEASAARALAQNGRNIKLLESVFFYHQQRQQHEQAGKLVRIIDALNGSGTLLAEWHEEAGRTDQAIAAYESSLAWEPSNEAVKHALAQVYLKEDQFERAIALFAELDSIPARHRRYVHDHAGALARAGRQAEALGLLRKALAEDPGDFRLRRALYLLDGKQMLDAYVTDGMELVQAFRADSWQEDSGAVNVLDEYLMELLPDGSLLSRVHIITRVQTKEAQVRYGEIFLPSNGVVYQVRLIKPDGRILVPERIDGKKSISMPGLEVGDFIEYDYLQGSKGSNLLPDGRMHFSRFYFQSVNLPTYRSNFVVIHPEKMKVHLFPMNYDLAPPKHSTEEGRLVTRYENSSLEAIIREPFMPMDEETMPIVQVSRPLSWEEIRDVYRQKLLRLKRSTPELRAFLEKHRGRKASEKETVERLYKAVAERIDGEGADANLGLSAAHILQLREGNRLLLLSTLLDLAGIDNRFVMVRPRNIKEIDYPGGNFKVYADPLLEVRPKGGKSLFLTADYKETVFNRPSPLFSAAKALVLAEGERFENLPLFTEIGENKEVSLSIQLAADGSADCEVVERISGYYSTAMKRSLKKIPADQLPQFFEMVLNRNFPGTTLQEWDMENLDDASKALKLHYRFRIQKLGRLVGRQLRLPAKFFAVNLSLAYIRTPSRSYPMLINSINSGYNSTVLTLPPGFAISRRPESRKIESDFGVYRLDVTQKGAKLTFTRDFFIPIQRIELEQYLDFYRFCADIDQLEREEIILEDQSMNRAAKPVVSEGGNLALGGR